MYLCTYEVHYFKMFKDEKVSASRDFGIEYSGNKCVLFADASYTFPAISDMCY